MAFFPAYQNAYLGLPEELAAKYPDLNFDNHCYLRIALDNTLGTKWDSQISRPAYKNLDESQLNEVRELLRKYKEDRELLLRHNAKSLGFRKKR